MVAGVSGHDPQSGARSSGGSLHVTVTGAPAAADRRLVRLNAAADLPTDPTSGSLVAADQVKASGFASSAKRALVRAHFDPVDTGIASIGVTLNADTAAEATARLTLDPDVGGGGAADEDSGLDVLSRANPWVLYDLRGTDAVVENLYVVGIAGDAGAPVFGETLVEIRVW